MEIGLTRNQLHKLRMSVCREVVGDAGTPERAVKDEAFKAAVAISDALGNPRLGRFGKTNNRGRGHLSTLSSAYNDLP